MWKGGNIMGKKRQALYTVLAYPDSLKALGLTVERVAEDFQQHFGCECQWALHDKDEGKKPHYHFDCGFEANVPPVMEFLKYCNSDKYVKKNASEPGKKGLHEVRVFAVTPYTGDNGEEIRYNHIIEYPSGRVKYLLHISKSSESDGKHQYDKSIIHSTPGFDVELYYSANQEYKRAKAQKQVEHAEDPFIEIFTMIDQMKIDNVAHLIAVCLGDPNKHWYIPYIKADLMKYNTLINGFIQQHKWEKQQMIGQDGVGLVEKMKMYHEARKLPGEDEPQPQPQLQPQPEPELQPEPKPEIDVKKEVFRIVQNEGMPIDEDSYKRFFENNSNWLTDVFVPNENDKIVAKKYRAQIVELQPQPEPKPQPEPESLLPFFEVIDDGFEEFNPDFM